MLPSCVCSDAGPTSTSQASFMSSRVPCTAVWNNISHGTSTVSFRVPGEHRMGSIVASVSLPTESGTGIVCGPVCGSPCSAPATTAARPISYPRLAKSTRLPAPAPTPAPGQCPPIPTNTLCISSSYSTLISGPARLDRSLELDFSLPSSVTALLNHATQYTYSVWVYPKQLKSGYVNIFSRVSGSTFSQQGIPSLWLTPDGTIQVNLQLQDEYGDWSFVGHVTRRRLPLSTWTLVAFSVDGAEGVLRIWYNDGKDGLSWKFDLDCDGRVVPVDATFEINTSCTDTDICIAELDFYNSALAPDHAASCPNSTTAPAPVATSAPRRSQTCPAAPKNMQCVNAVGNPIVPGTAALNSQLHASMSGNTASLMNTASQYSYTVWVYPASFSPGPVELFARSNGAPGGPQDLPSMWVTSNGSVQISLQLRNDQGSWITATHETSLPLPVSTWTLVSVVVDGVSNTLTVWFNEGGAGQYWTWLLTDDGGHCVAVNGDIQVNPAHADTTICIAQLQFVLRLLAPDATSTCTVAAQQHGDSPAPVATSAPTPEPYTPRTRSIVIGVTVTSGCVCAAALVFAFVRRRKRQQQGAV
ncbi:hypothetical protein PBRA_004007 [Plasmodiophora brassicae]|uniref:Uncharacterized protein n=1 Tax=Plasmodiophora brassicae TaxID=37360 RepID=A0A0G4IJ25_PLABS|nr:hypothetical protein PBRA_004007 [Plasmodiophora brassicae]